MKNSIRYFLIFIGSLLLDVSVFAQVNPGGGNGGGNGPVRRPPVPPTIPIDGGIGLLAAAGIAYGARKIYISKKEESNSIE